MPQRLIHKAQVLTKRISLNPNLDFSQITQSSQRGVGDSSQRQVPVVQPLRVIETPEDGVGAHAAPLSDNSERTVGLH
jgi:hypothetical protein